jgi:magnesium-transporting ATPase (P-type)
LDILTIVVPPALPAAMTVGTVYAQTRLKSKSIFCTSPPRINFGGKVKLVCFDKTGTLTEEGLDFSCVIPSNIDNDENGERSNSASFGDEVSDPGSQLGLNSHLLRALSCCHSLTHVHGRIVGDPLDLKMFSSTGWELEEPTNTENRFVHKINGHEILLNFVFL